MKLKILALWPLQRTLTDPALGSAGLRRIVGRFLGTSWKRCPRLSPTVHWSHDPIALQGGWSMPSSWSSGERKQACGHTALSRHTCPPWLCTPSPRRPLHGGPLHGGPLQVGKLREGWHCPCPVSVACPRLRTGGPCIVTEGENESVSPAGTADPAQTPPCPARPALVSPPIVGLVSPRRQLLLRHLPCGDTALDAGHIPVSKTDPACVLRELADQRETPAVSKESQIVQINLK